MLEQIRRLQLSDGFAAFLHDQRGLTVVEYAAAGDSIKLGAFLLLSGELDNAIPIVPSASMARGDAPGDVLSDWWRLSNAQQYLSSIRIFEKLTTINKGVASTGQNAGAWDVMR